MTREDFKSLCHSVRALWEQRLDTKDISAQLQVSEAECERALHRVLSIRRSVLGSLKASAE